jgi:hypothetical protein
MLIEQGGNIHVVQEVLGHTPFIPQKRSRASTRFSSGRP